MKRSIRALLCALSGLGVSMLNSNAGLGDVGVSTAHADEANPNASDCMSFQNDVQEKAIVVHASNVCERKLSCSMSYVVRCEDNGGNKTSSTNGSAHFALAAHAATEIPMSADQCKQGWSIDDVSWACR